MSNGFVDGNDYGEYKMVITKKGSVSLDMSEEGTMCHISDFHFEGAGGQHPTGYILALECARDRIDSLLKAEYERQACPNEEIEWPVS